MDVSSSTDATTELNRIKQKAEEEKCLVKERLAKIKAEYEQALKDKNRAITTEIEHIKKHMEDQMCNGKQHQKLTNISSNQLCWNYTP